MKKQTIRKKRKIAYRNQARKRFYEYIINEMVRRLTEKIDKAILFGDIE